jgi:hypothetical protein
LTCDFWAENEKNKCNGKSKGKIVGFSLRSRMTAETCNDNGNGNGNNKCGGPSLRSE